MVSVSTKMELDRRGDKSKFGHFHTNRPITEKKGFLVRVSIKKESRNLSQCSASTITNRRQKHLS